MDNEVMEYPDHECRFCNALKNRESNYRIDKKQSVIEIEYMCGTILKIEVPGKARWLKQCQGSTNVMLDNYDDLSDIW